jgi:hypothetical protein
LDLGISTYADFTSRPYGGARAITRRMVSTSAGESSACFAFGCPISRPNFQSRFPDPSLRSLM